MTACIDLVRREISDLSEKELDQVLEEMRAKQARFVREGSDSSMAAARAGREVADLLRAATVIEKRNAALNFKVRTEALDYVQTTWGDDQAEGIFALLYGSPKARFGSRASVNAAQDANFRKYTSGVAGDLEAAGLFDVLRRGEMDRDIARAMWSIGDEASLKKLPDQVVQIAKTLQKWQEVARLDGNRHGGWIGKLDNYVVRQSHNPDRLTIAGEAKWKQSIVARLDFEKTFPDGPPKDLDNWLHETFMNLTTGVRPKGDFTADKMAAFKGPGNLAKKLSQERVLQFKDADSWFDYNAEFGFGNLREAYITGLHRAAESNGLMQVLGTNPEYNLDVVVQAIRANLSRTDPAALKAFDQKTRNGTRIQNGLKEVSGQTRRVASRRLANVGAGLRVWNTLTGLGGAVVSAITDIPIRAAALKYQGGSYLGNLAEGVVAPLRRIVSGVGSVERKATLAAVGYFNEIAIGNLATRFSPDESVPGRLQRATHTFFKWNLLGGWTDEMRRSSLESMARFFGETAESDFGSMSERTRRTLERFRIGETEWNAIRKGIVEEGDGQKFLTPQAVRELPAQNFTDLAKDRINALKKGLAERLKRRTIADLKEQEWIQKRSDKLREELTAARIKLDERLKGLGKSVEGQQVKNIQEEIQGLNKKLSKLDETLEYAAGYWEAKAGGDSPAIERSKSIGFYGKRMLRDLGIDEGRAKEAMKNLKAEARQLGRDLARLRKELNEDFVDRWAERQEDLVAFADGVAERIAKRAEQSAKELTDLEPQINRILNDVRESTADKLQQLYADEVNSAVISPDARTLAFVRQGTQAGTPIGETLRLFWQFKTFGIAIMQRAFLREFYGYDYGRGGRFGTSELRGLAVLMAGGLGFGYLAMSAKDLLKGRTPRPIDDPKTWAASMAQGGAMGIYGDFLFGEGNRFGQGFLTTLGGPTVGKADQAYRLWNSLKNGDDAAAQSVKFAISNTPYANLFYTRMAADYLFLYELQESLNPGYLRRMERRVEQETGSEWWLRPTEAVH